MPATALPSLSDVRAFTGHYLTDAAQHWSDSAQRWTDTYDRLTRDVLRPAGTEWMGEAAEAAALRVGTDRVRVAGAADELTAAAATARRAADDLHATKMSLLGTVRAAEVAGFTVGEDFSLTSLATGTPAEVADREAEARMFGSTLRTQVLALVKADGQAAAEIGSATAKLQSLSFDDGVSLSNERDPAIQAAGFHGMPFPEGPPHPVPEPPPGGWSEDPLMRGAQKIAYGHASDPDTGHMHEFPGMTKAKLADLVHQKMLRAITDPSGLTIGRSDTDGVPVIYDPEDNVLIVRDTRPNATDGGTVFKPDPDGDPNFVTEKFGSYQSVFTAEELADSSSAPPAPPPPESRRGSVGLPGGTDIATPTPGSAAGDAGGGGGGGSWGDESAITRSFPDLGSIKDWGTYIPPEELAKQDGALGILGRIILGQEPPDPRDPDSWA